MEKSATRNAVFMCRFVVWCWLDCGWFALFYRQSTGQWIGINATDGLDVMGTLPLHDRLRLVSRWLHQVLQPISIFHPTEFFGLRFFHRIVFFIFSFRFVPHFPLFLLIFIAFSIFALRFITEIPFCSLFHILFFHYLYYVFRFFLFNLFLSFVSIFFLIFSFCYL